MVLDEETTNEICQVFEGVYESREHARDLTGSANDTMKGLAQRIAARSDEDPKNVLVSLKKSYKEFAENKDAKADTLTDAVLITNAILAKGGK